MGCARISLCILIKNILPGSTARITAIAFAMLTTLWSVSGVLVTLFACSLPSPWQSQDGTTCINVVSWANYVGSSNVVLEILLILIPLCIWNLRISARGRMSISLLFLSRLRCVNYRALSLASLTWSIVSLALSGRSCTCSERAKRMTCTPLTGTRFFASRSRRTCPSLPRASLVCTLSSRGRLPVLPDKIV